MFGILPQTKLPINLSVMLHHLSLFQVNHDFDHILRLHTSSCLFLLTIVIQEIHQTEPKICMVFALVQDCYISS